MSEPTLEFKLSSEYIELDNLLKATNIVPSGAQAKALILANAVKVNCALESRVRRKLRKGDTVDVEGRAILLV